MTPDEVGAYCRDVEDYLTRVNGGHLVRIVGPGFEVVRQWAEDGIPLRIVCRGIDRRVERHDAGPGRRPLRIEFCASDVREVHAYWRRAVGLTTGRTLSEPASSAVEANADGAAEATDRKRPSLTKHLERVIERLGRAAGRLDLSERLRDGLATMLTDLGAMREGKPARGPEREEREARLAAMDRELLVLVRETSEPTSVAGARVDAERDLASYRGRLTGDAWTRAVGATVDQLLRERLGLPTIEL
jgi:hypothetical protein